MRRSSCTFREKKESPMSWARCVRSGWKRKKEIGGRLCAGFFISLLYFILLMLFKWCSDIIELFDLQFLDCLHFYVDAICFHSTSHLPFWIDNYKLGRTSNSLSLSLKVENKMYMWYWSVEIDEVIKSKPIRWIQWIFYIHRKHHSALCSQFIWNSWAFIL